MRPTQALQHLNNEHGQSAETGNTRTIVLAITSFALGAILTTLCLRSGSQSHSSVTPAVAVQLSEKTRAILGHLTFPVTVRFYSLLDSNSAPALRDFSSRAEQLLAAYQQQGNGRISVESYNSSTNASFDEALADGIKGFDLDNGGGSFLGIVVSSASKREVLPHLSPEWEPALEADVSRAISRVAETPPGKSKTWTPAAAPTEVLGALKQKIPNYGNITLEEGNHMLREASLKDFSAVVNEMQAEVQKAEAELKQAKADGSTDGQAEALKRLQEIQNAQSARLREIAAKSQAEIAAWKQLKMSGN